MGDGRRPARDADDVSMQRSRPGREAPSHTLACSAARRQPAAASRRQSSIPSSPIQSGPTDGRTRSGTSTRLARCGCRISAGACGLRRTQAAGRWAAAAAAAAVCPVAAGCCTAPPPTHRPAAAAARRPGVPSTIWPGRAHAAGCRLAPARVAACPVRSPGASALSSSARAPVQIFPEPARALCHAPADLCSPRPLVANFAALARRPGVPHFPRAHARACPSRRTRPQ